MAGVLSSDIIKYALAPYLDNESKRNLYQCSKLFYKNLKPQLYFRLDLLKSFKYLLDDEYRREIDDATCGRSMAAANASLSSGVGASRLCLTFSYRTFSHRSLIRLISKYIPIIKARGIIPDANILDDDKIINNVRSLIDVDLDIACTNVTDVSALGGVHRLDLRSTKIRDVSMLGRVKWLSLERTKVASLTALDSVPELVLLYCEVDDEPMLGWPNVFPSWWDYRVIE